MGGTQMALNTTAQPALLRENEEDFDWIVEFIAETCDMLDGTTYHGYVNKNTSNLHFRRD